MKRKKDVTSTITGGAGFIGSHLAEALLAAGERILVIDDLSTGTMENLAAVEEKFRDRLEIVVADAGDARVMEELVKKSDRVYHLAAAVGVKLVVDEPVKSIERNLGPTRTALELAARYRKRIMLASTSEVYGRSDRERFSENDDCLIGPSVKRRWGYAASKLMDEFLAMAFFHEVRLNVSVVRLFNTVGPRQTGRYGMVVPTFVEQALDGNDITIYGDGEQTRSFTHVADVVRAIRLIMDNRKITGEVINVGSENEITVNRLAETIVKKTRSKSKLVRIGYDRAFGENFEDIRHRVPDISKLRRLTGFAPTITLDRILDDVIAYRKNRKGPRTRAERR